MQTMPRYWSISVKNMNSPHALEASTLNLNLLRYMFTHPLFYFYVSIWCFLSILNALANYLESTNSNALTAYVLCVFICQLLFKELYYIIHNPCFCLCSTTSISFKKCSKTEDLISWNGVSLYCWQLKTSFQCMKSSTPLEKPFFSQFINQRWWQKTCSSTLLGLALLNFLWQRCSFLELAFICVCLLFVAQVRCYSWPSWYRIWFLTCSWA